MRALFRRARVQSDTCVTLYQSKMVEVGFHLLLGSEGDARAVVSEGGRLQEHRVTHILSITSQQPDWVNPDLEDDVDDDDIHDSKEEGVVKEPAAVLRFATLFIQADDSPDTDLLHRFEQCCQFIKEGVEQQGTVLVHCVCGISRSATMVLAYLMQKEGRPLDVVLKELLAKKPDVKPNAGFMEQLKLWGAMKCRVDVGNKLYRTYRLQHMANTLNFQDQKCMEEVRSALSVDPYGLALESSAYYRCRKCRRMLFTEDSVLEHEKGKGQAGFKWHKRSQDLPSSTTTSSFEDHRSGMTNQAVSGCSSYFIEPVEWMEKVLVGNVEGKVLCPKCDSRLGSFNWVGQQCSCGQWVNPSFQIHKARVDETRSLIKRKVIATS